MNQMNPWIKKALYAIVILTVAALLIFSFQKNFEYVEKTQWQPLTGEAKANPLYASQLFLRRMGIPTKTVESLQDLSTLPGTDTAILISSSRQTLRDEQFSTLLDWIKNGGHLILTGITDWSSVYNVSYVVEESESGDVAESEVYHDEPDTVMNTPPSIDAFQDFLNVRMSEGIKFDNEKAEKVIFKGSERPLELGADYYSSIVMKQDNDGAGLEHIKVNEKNFAIRRPIEKGLITLVSNLDFIDNYNIGEYDHAEILWNLVRGEPATTRSSDLVLPLAVWLIHSDETASLLALLWKYWWALMITLAMLFVFWILRVSRRFGPLIAKETEDRRNLLEHIDASGAYYWKQQNQDVLIESTRSAAQQQLAKRIPGWNALSQQDQVQLLAKRLTINESHLAKSLYGNFSNVSNTGSTSNIGAHEFTQIIKQLEHIRTSI